MANAWNEVCILANLTTLGSLTKTNDVKIVFNATNGLLRTESVGMLTSRVPMKRTDPVFVQIKGLILEARKVLLTKRAVKDGAKPPRTIEADELKKAKDGIINHLVLLNDGIWLTEADKQELMGIAKQTRPNRRTLQSR